MSTGVQGKTAVESLSGHVLINGGKLFFKNGYFYGKTFPGNELHPLKTAQADIRNGIFAVFRLNFGIPPLYSISVANNLRIVQSESEWKQHVVFRVTVSSVFH